MTLLPIVAGEGYEAVEGQGGGAEGQLLRRGSCSYPLSYYYYYYYYYTASEKEPEIWLHWKAGNVV